MDISAAEPHIIFYDEMQNSHRNLKEENSVPAFEIDHKENSLDKTWLLQVDNSNVGIKHDIPSSG